MHAEALHWGAVAVSRIHSCAQQTSSNLQQALTGVCAGLAQRAANAQERQASHFSGRGSGSSSSTGQHSGGAQNLDGEK